MLLFMIAALSLFAGVVNLVPFRTSGVQTDGINLVMFWKGGCPVQRFIALANIQALGLAGERPRDYPADMVQMATGCDDKTAQHATALLFRAYWNFDLGNCDAAIADLEEALKVTGEAALISSALQNELASFIAWCRGDAERSAELFAKVKPGFIAFRFVYDRAQALVFLAASKREEARTALDAAMKGLANEPTAGEHMYRMEREWQQAIHEKLNAS